MLLSYLENFSKTSADDPAVVQNVLEETGTIVDIKLFPLIEEAEAGNFLAQAELFEIFTFGDDDITPNYVLAKRYFQKLQLANLESGDPVRIAEGLKASMLMHNQFEKYELAHDALMKCFKYTVANLEPNDWDQEIISLMAEHLEEYQDVESESE